MYMPDCNSASGMNGNIAIGIGDFKGNIHSVHAETCEDHSFLQYMGVIRTASLLGLSFMTLFTPQLPNH